MLAAFANWPANSLIFDSLELHAMHNKTKHMTKGILVCFILEILCSKFLLFIFIYVRLYIRTQSVSLLDILSQKVLEYPYM
ncbi:MAG TPA: hypothetical protein DCG33_07870 [Prevotellaceae bacterium]|nr:hypothetical protein [Prevotellaceae bacterium]